MPRASVLPPARFFYFAAAVVAAAGLMSFLGTPTASAAKPCWERVVDDWVDNGGIDGRYSPACLQAALRNVPEDVRAYSDFEERIKQALQDAFRNRFLQGSSGPGTTPSTSAKRPQIDRVEEVEPNVRSEPDGGPISSVLRTDTTDASSIPLPLIVLAALALLLMSAGGAGFAHRKLRARKVRAR